MYNWTFMKDKDFSRNDQAGLIIGTVKESIFFVL